MTQVNVSSQEVTQVKNAFGHHVRRCCASCMRKTIDEEGRRLCKVMPLVLKPCDCCPRWKMNRACERAGMSMGRVKRKAYLLYVATVRDEENETIQLGLMTERKCKSREQLRSEFEKEHGSIWEI